MNEQSQWELGGLALAGQLPAASLPVPEQLAIEGEFLLSEHLQPGGRLVRPIADVLVRFARIRTADDVLTFAKRFGVLRADERRNGRECREPLAVWLRRAAEARAILNISAALHRGDATALEDWRTIYIELPDRSHLPWLDRDAPIPAEVARFFLEQQVNDWITWANAQPSFEWRGELPGVTFGRYLPGLLATRLMIAVTGTEGLTICSACGNPYLRVGRQAKRGQRNYCETCGPKAGWRYAARRRTRTGPRRQTKYKRAAPRFSPAERATKLLVLAKKLRPPPNGNGAGAYWRRFHQRARALHLVEGNSPIASQMAYRRARQRLGGYRATSASPKDGVRVERRKQIGYRSDR